MKRQPRAHADRQEVRGKKGWEKRGNDRENIKERRKKKEQERDGEEYKNRVMVTDRNSERESEGHLPPPSGC